MVENFYKLIIARPQRKTFAQVPLSLKDAVHDTLLVNGYDDNGDLLPVDYYAVDALCAGVNALVQSN